MARPDFSLLDLPTDPAIAGEPRLVFYDAEFTDLNADADMLSIGLVVADSDVELYIEISDANFGACSDFVKTEVMPFLGRHNPEVLTREQAAARIDAWLDGLRGGNRQQQIHLVADSSWDWELLLKLYPPMTGQLSWPQRCNISGRTVLAVLPLQDVAENVDARFAAAMEDYLLASGERHHALADARAQKVGWLAVAENASRSVTTLKGLARSRAEPVSIDDMNRAPAAAMKGKYSVKELMGACDPQAPMPADLVTWDTMVPVGLECDIEITEEDGAFVARCPNPEVASDGKTPEEALANLREALDLFFDRKSRS